jgi:hypothetical protein
MMPSQVCDVREPDRDQFTRREDVLGVERINDIELVDRGTLVYIGHALD